MTLYKAIMTLKEKAIGMKFGKLTIVKWVRVQSYGGNIYLCKCDCGGEKEVIYARLSNGHTKSCGCLITEANEAKIKNMKGMIFGRWTVIERDFSIYKKYGAFWTCKCECGNTQSVCGRDLRSGSSSSCGCLTAIMVAERFRLYEPWYRTAKSIYDSSYSDGDLTIDDFIKLSKQNCHYCGIEPYAVYNVFVNNNRKSTPKSLQDGYYTYNRLDRVNSSKPHNIDNVVPCCKHCNTAKLDYSEEDFKDWIIKVYNHYIVK